MANKVFNMAGGLHSAAAYSAFESALFGSCVATASDFMATAGSGLKVNLSAGNGLISTGTGFARRIASDSTNSITIATAASSARIDSIVAYIDNSVTPTTSVVDNTNNILKFVAVSGTPAANPLAPTSTAIQSAIGAGNPYMVLWDVTIPANATTLTSATFTDRRNIATIASLRSELDAFKASMTLTSFTSWPVTSNAMGSNITCSGTLNLAQSADGSLFKVYGTFYAANSASSSKTGTLVAVPGLSGKYGVKTGLQLATAPSSAFQVDGSGVAHYRANYTGTAVVRNAFAAPFAVGTDGYIYVNIQSNASQSIEGTVQDRTFYPACLYFNTNFGDSGDN